MKTRILHIITFLLKICAGLLVAAPAMGFDPASAGLGMLLFIIVSASKDFLLAIGDWVDDGKRNNSFTGLVRLLVIGLCALLFLPACKVAGDGTRHTTVPINFRLDYETADAIYGAGYYTGKGIVAGIRVRSSDLRAAAQK